MALIRRLLLAFCKLVFATILLGCIAIGVGAATYFAGATIPLLSASRDVTIENWNRTGKITFRLTHTAQLRRAKGRPRVRVDVSIAKIADTLERYLDGGRTEIVRCGAQSLSFHRLDEASVQATRSEIRLTGRADMELSGLAVGRDDWRVRAAFGVTNSATSISIRPQSLRIAGLPEVMQAALLRDLAEQRFTRSDLIGQLAHAMPAEAAARLRESEAELDLRFGRVRPRMDGDAIRLAVGLSVNEPALLRLLGREAALVLPRALFGPAPAEAQLLDSLDNLGRVLGKGLKEGKSPEEILSETVESLTDCATTL